MPIDMFFNTIYNPDSTISNILKELLTMLDTENRINEYSISTNKELRKTTLESELISIKHWENEFTFYKSEINNCSILGKYNPQGPDNAANNDYISALLFDNTNYYIVRSEKNEINDELVLHFKHFVLNPDTIMQLNNKYGAEKVETLLDIGDTYSLNLTPDIEKVFSMSDGAEKIIEFFRKVLHGEWNIDSYYKLVNAQSLTFQ